ncbi:MAG: hypothetical protein NVSMB9_33790 [Isosphaeraceae bacterium]
MRQTPETSFAEPDDAATRETTTGSDWVRRLTHGILAVYLIPAVLLVLVVGVILAVVVKGMELVVRATGVARGPAGLTGFTLSRPLLARRAQRRHRQVQGHRFLGSPSQAGRSDSPHSL